MRVMSTILALCLSTTASADTWQADIAGGIHTAKISKGGLNEVNIMCDAGINAPITSINFMINGVVPDPMSTVTLEFDKSEPIYAFTDEEGGLGSFSATDAELFSKVIELIKAKRNLTVRIFTGDTHTFALRGSSKAIGTVCETDYARLTLAGQ